MKFNLTSSQEALIYQCRVIRVYPATMTVDVFVPEINNEFQGVYILTNNIQTAYGTISMPEIDSVGLIALYHKSKQPVILGFIPPYKFNQGEQKFEYLKPGESQVSGKGGAFFRSDILGNATVGTSTGVGTAYEYHGKKVDSFLEKNEISNFHRKDLRISDNDDIIKISDIFEIHETIPNSVVCAEDVLKWEDLQEDKIESVLSDVEKSISDLSSAMTEIRNIFLRSSGKLLTQEDVQDFENAMRSYQMPQSGYCVKGKIFGDTGLKIGLYDGDEEVAGIEIDENGGKLTGRWV